MKDDGANIAVNSLDEMQGSVDGDFGFEFGPEFNQEDMHSSDEMPHGHMAQYDFTEVDDDHFMEDAPLDIGAPLDDEDEDSLNGRPPSFGSELEEGCSVSCESEPNDRNIAVDDSNDEKSNDGEDSLG
jgi:hypothetical protein